MPMPAQTPYYQWALGRFLPIIDGSTNLCVGQLLAKISRFERHENENVLESIETRNEEGAGENYFIKTNDNVVKIKINHYNQS